MKGERGESRHGVVQPLHSHRPKPDTRLVYISDDEGFLSSILFWRLSLFFTAPLFREFYRKTTRGVVGTGFITKQNRWLRVITTVTIMIVFNKTVSLASRYANCK